MTIAFRATVTSLLLLSALGTAVVAAPPETAAEMERLFADPPQEFRPWTRWWWHNGAATREEMARELKLMKEAGMGGAEICTLDAVLVPEVADHRSTKLGTTERTALYVACIEETAKLGMQIDITPATKWPYNGTWVTPAFSPQSLVAAEVVIEGPAQFSGPVPAASGGKGAVLETLVLSDGDGPGKVVLDKVDGGKITLEIPKGKHRLTAYYRAPKGGTTIDHFSAEAMNRHLDWAIKPIVEQLPKAMIGTTFRAVYCDNIEGFWGETWTSGLLEDFKRNRGYDLAPYLPLIALGEEKRNDATKDTTGGTDLRQRVRFDINLTLGEINRDDCFGALRKWTHAHGLLSRAEGHMPARGDLIDTNGAVDMPEMEVYQGGFGPSRGAGVARFAAHLYGRNIVSCESFTWETPHFRASLQTLREASDKIFSVGVNHIVNHGYTYSPPAAEWPGWLFYASSNINHNNPYWPYYRALGDYTARTQMLMRAGRPVVDIGFYGGSGNELDKDSTRKADRVSDHALLTQSKVDAGILKMGVGHYRVLVLRPEAALMRLETLKQIESLVQQGATVATLALPKDVPGFFEHAAQAEQLRATAQRLFPASASLTAKTVGQGKTYFVAANQLAEVYKELGILPQVNTPEASAKLEFEHRQGKDFDTFFLYNSGDAPFVGPITCRAEGAPERWEAKTGTLTAVDPTRVEIAAKSAALIVYRRDSPPPRAANATYDKVLIAIEGPWRVAFHGMDRSPVVEKTFDALADWTGLADLAHFSGTARYTKSYTLITVPNEKVAIDLGTVHDVASVTVNGRQLGIVFEAPYRVAIPAGVLKVGVNTLEVAVANRMENAIVPLLTTVKGKKEWKKMPIRNLDAVGVVHQSGMLGPVRLLAVSSKD